jgi:hypothetical protein
MRIAGWDIGGANIKVAIIEIGEDVIKNLKVEVEYFPIWKRGKNRLLNMLVKLKKSVEADRVDLIGVTMTAELSDVYFTKREGVNHILDCVEMALSEVPVYVLDVDANLLDMQEARKNHLKVAAANWAATGWMVSQLVKNCIVIDVGSTTTSIIPIANGKVIAKGKNDMEKLIYGELVYTGALRTNVATIVNKIPLRGHAARVSSELFALSGDVHLVLGNITSKEYTTETADGRGSSYREAIARLARVVCADIEILTQREVLEMAKYVYTAQVKQVADALSQVYKRILSHFDLERDFSIVVTGLGKDFLAKKAAEKLGFSRIIDLKDILGYNAALASPSVGVALRVATLTGWRPKIWKP